MQKPSSDYSSGYHAALKDMQDHLIKSGLMNCLDAYHLRIKLLDDAQIKWFSSSQQKKGESND